MQADTFKCQTCNSQILIKCVDIHKVMCKSSHSYSYSNKSMKKVEDQIQNLIPCTQCGESIPFEQYVIHMDQCEGRQNVPCQRCGLLYPIYLIEEHKPFCQGQQHQGPINNNIKIQKKQSLQQLSQNHSENQNSHQDIDLIPLYQLIGNLAIVEQQQQQPQPLSQKQIKQLKSITIKSSQECSICCVIMKKNQQVTQLPCKHKYHRICISAWLVKNPKCPYCRKLARKK